MKEKIQGSFSLLLATFIWGFAFVAQSVGMELIGPFTFQAVRCFLAVIFLVLFTLLAELPKAPIGAYWQRWTDAKLWKAGIPCGIALFLAVNFQQLGLLYTDAGKAGFLTAMYIVIVPLLGIFLRRRPSTPALVSVGIAVVGLYLLSCAGVSRVNLGDVLLLCCAFCFAVQIMLIDRFAAGVDSLRLNCVQSLVVTVLSAPVMLLFEDVSMPNIVNCWLPLCFAGILSMGVAYSLQIVGQKKLEPTAASLIMSLESVFAALGGWMILHETMTSWEMAGCALVFTAVIISQLPERRKTVSGT